MQVNLSQEEKIKIANGDDMFAIMQAVLKRENNLNLAKEHFWVVGLSASHVLEYIELVALGSDNVVHVKPLDVFHTAAAKNVPNIILVHNHPSGNLEASGEDIRLTARLVEGGKLLEIKILSHMVISETGYGNVPL